jgi:hypothetical protein
MFRCVTGIFAGSALLLASCSLTGPKANVAVIETEIQKTRSIENIIVPHASGVDSSGGTGKALLAAAIGAYGKRSRPMTEASALVADVGGPEGTGDILVSAYQAEFIKAVDDYVESNGAKTPKALSLPSAKLKFTVGKGMKGMKTLARKLNADAATVTGLAKALKGGDNDGFLSGVEKSPEVMVLMQKMNDYVFRELDVTYVLVTHIKGNEADWKAGKKVTYAAALVNVRTGKLRYFAAVDAERGSARTPYISQLTTMSKLLLREINDEDELPPPVAVEKTGKRKKKTAGVLHRRYDFR